MRVLFECCCFSIFSCVAISDKIARKYNNSQNVNKTATMSTDTIAIQIRAATKDEELKVGQLGKTSYVCQ